MAAQRRRQHLHTASPPRLISSFSPPHGTKKKLHRGNAQTQRHKSKRARAGGRARRSSDISSLYVHLLGRFSNPGEFHRRLGSSLAHSSAASQDVEVVVVVGEREREGWRGSRGSEDGGGELSAVLLFFVSPPQGFLTASS